MDDEKISRNFSSFLKKFLEIFSSLFSLYTKQIELYKIKRALTINNTTTPLYQHPHNLNEFSFLSGKKHGKRRQKCYKALWYYQNLYRVPCYGCIKFHLCV